MKIALVGEAWGADEERERMPFVGAAGWCLNKMLEDAGIRRADCHLTNVFNLRPPGGNDVNNLCGKRDAVQHRFAPLSSGKYILDTYLPEVERLNRELLDLRPNLAVALGGTASWALLGTGGITKVRGTVAASSSSTPCGIEGLKVLPTYHPAAVLRDWSLRPTTVLDLIKAKRECEFPDIRRPERKVYLDCTLEEMDWYFDTFIVGAKILGFDIETSGTQITCIGFAPGTDTALVVPFVDYRKPGGSYWPRADLEVQAWRFVQRVLSTSIPKVGQNTLYDIHFLWRRYGITVTNYVHDTMLLSHAIQPESPKGLAFLGSCYTNEASWKLMRTKNMDTVKREA